jgi:hypothetical protein
MRLRQRLGLRAGIAILTAAAVLLEIALHRVYAALFGQHLALAVLPLALLGAGAGGVVLYLAPSIARPPALLARLGYLAALTAAGTLAALLIIVHVKAPDAFDRGALGRLLALLVPPALPAFFAGLAIFSILRHAARDLGRLGFTAFAAAAIAGPAAVALLRAGAPRIGLAAMIGDALAALCFYLAARGQPIPRTRGAVVATALLASCVLLLGDLGAPWLKISGIRWTPFDKTEVQEWTPLGFVTVDRPAGGMSALRTDGTFGVHILEGKTPPPFAPDELAYTLHKEPGPVAVLGAGGGRELRVALKVGQKEIHAVEPNAFVVRALMGDRYKKMSGDLFDKPEVHVAVEDPRAFLRGTKLRFRTIVFTLPDQQTPAAQGVLAADPAPLYTVEAIRDALDRLTPDGTLVLSRWDGEVDRLVSLSAAGLRLAGIADPPNHLYGCSAQRSTSLLVTRAPIAARDLTALRNQCRRSKFNEAYAADQPHGELRRRLAAEPDARAVAAGELTDLTPPTDDRPYFFATLPRRLLGATLSDWKALSQGHQALLVLAAMIALAVAALALGLVVPALRRAPDREHGARMAPLVYFAATGAALVLAQGVFAARLPVLLGHAGHALTTVQVALFAFAGAGALLGGRGAAFRAGRSAGYRAQALVVLLAAAAVGLGPVIEATLGLPLPARLGIAIALLAPVGLLLGSLPVLGIKLLAARTPELVPWCLGAAALAAAGGVMVAVMLGYGAALLLAGAMALVAAASVPARR